MNKPGISVDIIDAGLQPIPAPQPLDAPLPAASAELSNCGRYRYYLSRVWNWNARRVLFIMLNPSTANAYVDDPTIRRCIGFAKLWGYGGLSVVNLFPFRATDPRELLKADNPLGVDNWFRLREASLAADLVVAAWGNAPIVKAMQKRCPEYKPLRDIAKPLHYIELAKDGTPKHPLYLRGDLYPQPFEAPTPRPLIIQGLTKINENNQSIS